MCTFSSKMYLIMPTFELNSKQILKPVIFIRKLKLTYANTSTVTKEVVKIEKKQCKSLVKVEEKFASDEVTKESLQWRLPWNDRQDGWTSKFALFGSDHNNADVMKFLQTPIDLRPATIKKWWLRKQEEKEIFMQQYIPERNKILGNNLAAAHFIVYRGGSVRFHHEPDWIKRDENNEYDLPAVYVRNKIVQAIDCAGMQLHYEGLVNMRDLQKLEWLSFYDCEHMDDWCLDRISSMFRDSLRYLDVRKCKKVTSQGIGALHRIKTLRVLYVDDIQRNDAFELTCLLLQELLPELEIKS